MLRKIFQVIGVTESTATFAEYVVKVLMFFGLVGAGGVTAVAAASTPLYAEYGWLALIFAALLSMALLSLAYFLWAQAYKKYREGVLLLTLEKKSTNFNPRETVYRRQVFRVQEMFDPFSVVVSGKTFEECDIIGPGIITFLDGVRMNTCSFIETGDIIEPIGNPDVAGALAFFDCSFRECRFFRTGIITNSPVVVGSLTQLGMKSFSKDSESKEKAKNK